MNEEMHRDIRRTLKSICEYIGVDTKYAVYATLQTELERLIKRWAGKQVED